MKLKVKLSYKTEERYPEFILSENLEDYWSEGTVELSVEEYQQYREALEKFNKIQKLIKNRVRW